MNEFEKIKKILDDNKIEYKLKKQTYSKTIIIQEYANSFYFIRFYKRTSIVRKTFGIECEKPNGTVYYDTISERFNYNDFIYYLNKIKKLKNNKNDKT